MPVNAATNELLETEALNFLSYINSLYFKKFSLISFYFVFTEAKESLRQSSHRTLREACTNGDVVLVKSIINELGIDAPTVLNIQPNGLNTLLFM